MPTSFATPERTRAGRDDLGFETVAAGLSTQYLAGRPPTGGRYNSGCRRKAHEIDGSVSCGRPGCFRVASVIDGCRAVARLPDARHTAPSRWETEPPRTDAQDG